MTINLIVLDIKITRVKYWCFKVKNLLVSICFLKLAKVLLSKVYYLLMLHVSNSTDYHVLAEVHPLVVVNNHISRDLINVVNLAKNRQAHHMIPVHIEINVLHKCFI